MSVYTRYHIAKTGRCENCERDEAEHVKGHCLFEPTKFRELTRLEIVEEGVDTEWIQLRDFSTELGAFRCSR